MIEVGYRETDLEQLEDFFEFAPVGMLLADSAGRVELINAAALELLGCLGATEQMIGKPVIELFEDAAVGRQVLDALAAGQQVLHFECFVRTKQGQPEPAIVDANVQRSGDSITATRWFLRPRVARELPSARTELELFARDITEEQRRARLDLLNDFFDHAPVGVHFVGLNGVIMRANEAEIRLLGFGDEPDKYIGRHVSEIHYDKAVVEDLLSRLVRGQPVIGHEAYLIRKGGSLQPVHIYSGLRTKDGKFQNTRCFLFNNPTPGAAPPRTTAFSWPRNEMDPAGETVSGAGNESWAVAIKYVTGRKRVEEAMGFLAEVSATITAVADFPRNLARVAHLTVPYLADWCSITLLRDGDAEQVAIAHADQISAGGAREIADVVFGDVVEVSGSAKPAHATVTVPHTNGATAASSSEPKTWLSKLPGITAAMRVPIVMHGELVGFVALATREDGLGRVYGAGDVALAEVLARHIACAVTVGQLRSGA